MTLTFSQSFVKVLINQTPNLDIWDSKIPGTLYDLIIDYHLEFSRPIMCRKVYCWVNRVQFGLQSIVYVLPLRNVTKITIYVYRVSPSKQSNRLRFYIPSYYLMKECPHTRVPKFLHTQSKTNSSTTQWMKLDNHPYSLFVQTKTANLHTN